MASIRKLELFSLICMFAIGFSCKQKPSAQKRETADTDRSRSERDGNSISDEENNVQNIKTILKDEFENEQSVQVTNKLCTVEYRYINPCKGPQSGCSPGFKPVQNVLEVTCADKKQKYCRQVRAELIIKDKKDEELAVIVNTGCVQMDWDTGVAVGSTLQILIFIVVLLIIILIFLLYNHCYKKHFSRTCCLTQSSERRNIEAEHQHQFS